MTDSDDLEREKANAELVAALIPQRVSVATRARLLARAAADAHARGIARSTPTPRESPPPLTIVRRRGIPTPIFAGVALALAAALVFIVKVRSDFVNQRNTFIASDFLNLHRIDSLTTTLSSRDQLITSLTGAQVRVVGLSAGETKSPRALMFWDRSTNRWTFIAHNLAQLQAGRTYQLWLVTASKKIPAATFRTTPAGDAFVQVTYSLDKNALKAVAVTEEPAGGVAQPTGAMIVVGTAGSQ